MHHLRLSNIAWFIDELTLDNRTSSLNVSPLFLGGNSGAFLDAGVQSPGCVAAIGGQTSFVTNALRADIVHGAREGDLVFGRPSDDIVGLWTFKNDLQPGRAAVTRGNHLFASDGVTVVEDPERGRVVSFTGDGAALYATGSGRSLPGLPTRREDFTYAVWVKPETRRYYSGPALAFWGELSMKTKEMLFYRLAVGAWTYLALVWKSAFGHARGVSRLPAPEGVCYNGGMDAKNVLITGASSGVGAAVALECARRGAANLFLCGRDGARLEEVAARCRAAGAVQVHTRVLDVTDEAAARAWIEETERTAPVEVFYSNAGVATGREDDAANVRRTFGTNVGGSLNIVLPALDVLRARGGAGRRQIVITASIAGYAPLATCPAYAATKAAMKSWGLSLRGMLRREGIRVNVVCPGFVRSRITDRNTCPMPFFMEADKAARIIVSRVERDIGLIAFPWPMRLASWFLGAVPWRLAEFVSRLLPEKNKNR